MKAIETQSNTNKTNISTLQSEVSANKANISNLNSKTDKINENLKLNSNNNLLLNSHFLVNQFGTSTLTLNKNSRNYITDMWVFDVLADASADSNSVNVMNTPRRLASKSVKRTSFKQYIEKARLDKFIGKKLTVSFKVMAQYETGVKVQFIDANITYHTSQVHKVPGFQNLVYHIVSSTFTLNSLDDTKNPCVSLTVDEPYNNSGWFDVISAKLEVGEVATDHGLETHETELLKCKRYYETQVLDHRMISRGDSHMHFHIWHDVEKHTVPTLTVKNDSIRSVLNHNTQQTKFTQLAHTSYRNDCVLNFEKSYHGIDEGILVGNLIVDARLW